MPQISFTPKNQTIYDEFKTLWLQYQLDHKCSLTAPEFLNVALDAFKERQAVYAAMQDIKELQPVVIKDSDNRYINTAAVATTNLFLTDDRSEAMVFDSPDKARAFLRKCGRSVEGWIFELVNKAK